jgi:UDP-3-O-[3-hydroxymyristoyl] glucosamine N-acyltransferase
MNLSSICNIDKNLKLISKVEIEVEISSISTIDNFYFNKILFIKNKKFLEKFLSIEVSRTNPKGILIFEEQFWNQIPANERDPILNLSQALLVTTSVPLSITILSKVFYDKIYKSMNLVLDGRQLGSVDIHPNALIGQNVFIGEKVKIEEGVLIAPGCVILPEVTIGAYTQIYPHVTIYPFSKIGKHNRIHSGVSIGADGFGYHFHQGEHKKIWHFGGVKTGDLVEIGANTTIDTGTFSPTLIGDGTKIDNGVQIGHNVKIGKHCILCGHVGISGSAVLEDYVVMGGKAGVGPDAFIGQGSQIAGAALVNEGAIWPKGSKLGGHPARDLKEWMRGFAYIRKMSLNKE